jgi:hypothetical protein
MTVKCVSGIHTHTILFFVRSFLYASLTAEPLLPQKVVLTTVSRWLLHSELMSNFITREHEFGC